MSTALTLAVIAAVLEIVGTVLTVIDIRRARDRLTDYLGRPGQTYASLTTVVEANLSATLSGPEQSLEQRIEALEAWRGGLAEELRQGDKKLYARLTERFRRELDAAEMTVNYKLDGLREFVAGEGRPHWFVAYRGPIILGVGVAAGLAGNIVSAL
ncbi:hypothetical protein [Streptomyces phaeochromogenes]